MSIWTRLSDATRRRKARNLSQELSYQLYSSPICSNYENLFAQVRPLVNDLKVVFPYGVGRNGARLPMSRTPELDLLHDPNDEMGWAEFADAMFSTWLTEDELDVRVHFDRSKVVGYTILPPQTRTSLGYGRWQWNVMTPEGEEVLDGSTIMRLRYSRAPRDLERGVSPASSVKVWAQIDDLISQYQRAYFENGAIPATLTFISASTQEKYLQTRNELENNLRGAKNRNKTVYVWRQFNNDTGQSADQIEVKSIQGTNSTLAIKEIVDIINDRLNKAVGVSNFLLGDDSSAKYDNAELSNEQFTKRRVYPALVSFWNQFQHELDRITGGLGYGISFDLEIPELTDRKRAIADINRIDSESLVNLISAGSRPQAAVKALGLSDAWGEVANGIYEKALAGEISAPVSVDYSAPKSPEKTADAVPTPDLADAPKHDHCDRSADVLPPMTDDEKRIYNILIELAEQVQQGAEPDAHWADEIVEVMDKAARLGGEDGAKALELLADDEVSAEIVRVLTAGEVDLSPALSQRISERANTLVEGLVDYTREKTRQILDSPEPMTANELAEALKATLPEKRAELIARNEVVYAMRSGRLDYDKTLADKFGLNIDVIWRCRNDSLTCETCRALDGTRTHLGDAYAEFGRYVEPSSWNDFGTIPSAHPNCRCYFDETLADFVPGDEGAENE